VDESGISERPTRVRTWAPKGQTPIIQFHFNWTHVSVIAGLTRTNCLFRLHEGSIKKEEIVEFLKALKAHLEAAAAGDLGWIEGAPQSLGARLPGQLGWAHPDRLSAALRARHESGRVPVGLAQAARAGQLLPNNLSELHATARNKLKSAQKRPSIIAACWMQATLW
jgi:hypothetical protein